MRILEIHKFFYPHAGSETAFFNTRALLKARGHEVVDFAMSDPRNHESQQANYFAAGRYYTSGSFSKRLKDALFTVYSPDAKASIARLLDRHAVDVAHIHSFSHQLTFSIVDELASRQVPMVMTLHDYKIGCPAYVGYRDGRRCFDCSNGSNVNALRNKCLKGSRAASLVASFEAGLARTRGSWQEIGHFIAPSAFAKSVAVGAGIAESRVTVLPNFILDTERKRFSERTRVPRALDTVFFAGRLEEVKGIRWLIETFVAEQVHGQLRVAGAGGELEGWVRSMADSHDRVTYLGRLERQQVLDEMASSTVVAVPSLWDENNPFSILEAQAVGTPVIATSVGGLPEMVTDGEDGFIVAPGDTAGLSLALRTALQDPTMARRMGEAGQARVDLLNSEETHAEALLKVLSGAAGREAP